MLDAVLATWDLHKMLVGICIHGIHMNCSSLGSLCLQGYKLHKLIEARMKEGDPSRKVTANVQLWETHEDLLRLAQIISRS